MRVHAALVSAVTVCRAEFQPLLILVSLGLFPLQFTFLTQEEERFRAQAIAAGAAAHTAGV